MSTAIAVTARREHEKRGRRRRRGREWGRGGRGGKDKSLSERGKGGVSLLFVLPSLVYISVIRYKVSLVALLPTVSASV